MTGFPDEANRAVPRKIVASDPDPVKDAGTIHILVSSVTCRLFKYIIMLVVAGLGKDEMNRSA